MANLKVIMCIHVIICHSLFPYCSDTVSIIGIVPTNSNNFDSGYVLFPLYSFGVQMMSLFFFISGYFVPYSYNECPDKFFRKKLVHLGIPIVLMYMFQYVHSGHIGFSHMWFLEILLCFMFYFFIAKKMNVDIPYSHMLEPSVKNILLFTFIILLLSAVIRIYFPIMDYYRVFKCIYIEPAQHIKHISFFFLGVLYGKYRLIGHLNPTVGKYMSFGLLFVVIFPWFVFQGFSGVHTLLYSLYDCLSCVVVVISFLFLSRRYLNKTNKMLDWLSDQSMLVYFIHVFVIWFSVFLLDDLIDCIIAKCILIIISSIILSFVISSVFKQFKIIRMIF